MIFVNSFMWVLTHMPNQGAQPCDQGAVEFPLISLVLIRLLPSRVGFAERDASRPAFGGSSLVSLTRHTCVGGGPIGGALSVCVCVCPCVPCVLERAGFKSAPHVFVDLDRDRPHRLC